MTATTDRPATLDERAAQQVATILVGQALARLAMHDAPMDGITMHGEHYTIPGPVRVQSRPGQLDGIVSFTVADGSTEHAISVTLMVAAAPGGAA